MPFTCFRCGRRHKPPPASEKFFQCPCGEKIELEELRAFERIVGDIEDRQQFEEIQRMADEISLRIVSGEYSEIDVDIAKEKLRDLCARYFPEKMYLFEMLYASRFKRLWEQFRSGSESEF